MKKFLKNVLSSVLVLLFLFFLFFLAYIYVPRNVNDTKKSFLETSPEEYSSMSQLRKDVLFSFDNFVLQSSTSSAKKLIQLVYSSPYKLNKEILADIKEEVENYNGDRLKVWYVYNMGTIAKLKDKSICFDLSTVITSYNLLELSNVCDYLLLTHEDGDHFNPGVAKNVLEKGSRVIILDETGIFEKSIQSLVSENLWENIYNLDNKKRVEIGDLSVLGIKTMHRMDEKKDNSWLEVSLGGYNIVHTGDGVLDDYKEAQLLGKVDVLLANVIVYPISLKDIASDYVIPLHMHELGHDRSFLERNSYNSYLQELDRYDGTLESKIYPLLWGESLEIE